MIYLLEAEEVERQHNHYKNYPLILGKKEIVHIFDHMGRLFLCTMFVLVASQNNYFDIDLGILLYFSHAFALED